MSAPGNHPSRRRLAFPGTLVVLLLALAGGFVAGCGGGDHAPAMPTMDASPGAAMASPTAAAHDPDSDAAAVEAAWAARPGFVSHANAMVQEAYRYAVERPDVIQWLPCYCGCAAMEHRSNLDCFIRSRIAGGAVAFEEHASYCDVCVDTALLAKKRMAEGRSLVEIRAEVDATFGGKGAPGTPTDLPEG